MSAVTNVITPIVQMGVYVAMAGGFIWFILLIFKKFIPNFSLIMKYKIFRRSYKENDVEWCMDAVKKKMDDVAVKKTLLINGNSKKRIREIMYILEDVRTQMKGGFS